MPPPSPALRLAKRNLTSSDGQLDTVYKLRVWDKVRALEMLAKHFALLVDRVEVEADHQVVAALPAARKRAVS